MRLGLGLGLGGGLVAFNPLQISGLLVWLDARVVSQSGGVLTAWNDQSGNGKNATIVGSPGVTASDANWNNQQSVTWSGTNRITLPDLGITTGDFTVVLCAYQTNANADFFGTTDATPLMRCFNSSSVYTCMRNGQVANDIQGGTDTAKNIIVWQTNGTTNTLYRGAKTPITNSNNVAADLTGKTLMLGNFGGGANSAFTQGGSTTQFLVYNSKLSSTQVAQLLNYFGTLYNITIGA